MPFVRSARALGAGSFYIMLRHILPNTKEVVFAKASLAVAGAMFTEAGISFLGLGDPTQKSWGDDASLRLYSRGNRQRLLVVVPFPRLLHFLRGVGLCPFGFRRTGGKTGGLPVGWGPRGVKSLPPVRAVRSQGRRG
ncbi:MAG: ABC transporter permease subunit [Desulfotomaculales bacterium]